MIPIEIKLHQISGILEVVFQEDIVFKLSAEYLRVFSPSAEVKGHGPGQEVLQHGKKMVKISELEPQGNYAIKIIFSDGHNSGIFSWSYLYALGDKFDANWSEYLKRLNAAKKNREPQFIAVG
ncbi:MAG: DUF971 family protein [Candidatus Azotimanducaceae bacterium]|jgi:DUF971 family protein